MEHRISVLLSLQRALLGNVPMSLRGVSVNYDDPKKVVIEWFFDGEISEEDQETADDFHTEVIADFDEDVKVTLEVKRVDYPERIDPQGQWVYYRKEQSLPDE